MTGAQHDRLSFLRQHFPVAPRPWADAPDTVLLIVDANGQPVARLSSTRGKTEPELVNLAHIVQCVNAHDQLVAALRSCVMVMERDLAGLRLIQPELNEARAALLQVERAA